MPAIRPSVKTTESAKRLSGSDTFGFTGKGISKSTRKAATNMTENVVEKRTKVISQEEGDGENAFVDWAELGERDVSYPVGTARLAYKSADGKRVTPHQWAVYDLVRTIPCGKVTTYKYICDKLGAGSPRSVGSALRNNPFAPMIPCHRVIASDLTLGGFMGEWGTESAAGSRCARKREMLVQEGVVFDTNGKLGKKEDVWKWD